MRPLKIDISGVRGLVGETLTSEMMVNFACAFGTILKSGKIGIGTDTRASRQMVKSAVLSGLISSGCDIVDLGICPTPVIQYTTKHLGLKGAIAITASHNDSQWNALKFIKANGNLLNFYEGQELLDAYHQGEFTKATWDKLGKVEAYNAAAELYVNKLCKYLDAGKIRKAKLKVIVDNCNGAGGEVTKLLLDKLSCELIMINEDVTGEFSHDPEPTISNMKEIASIIKPIKADVGFMLDADVDRIGIVAENGLPLSEEYTFCLLVDYILSKKKGPVVTNLSTTRAIDDLAKKHGVPLIRTKIGQAYLIEQMINESAVISGEGSGGVSVSDFQYAFDGFLAMGLILEMLADKKKISESVKSLPRYFMVKKKIECSSEVVYSVIDKVREVLLASYSADYLQDKPEIDLTDGVKIDWQDSWLHIRASNTEPLIRIIAESVSRDKAAELADAAFDKIKACLR